MKKKLIVIAILLLVVAFLYVPNLKLYEYSDGDPEVIFRAKAEQINDDRKVYLLIYTYTTGVGWVVEKTTDENLDSKGVVLNTVFDPRLLKDNDDFELDCTAKLLVTSSKKEAVNYEDDEAALLYADEITVIKSNDGSGFYRVKDMSGAGILKAIIGTVNPKYRQSA